MKLRINNIKFTVRYADETLRHKTVTIVAQGLTVPLALKSATKMAQVIPEIKHKHTICIVANAGWTGSDPFDYRILGNNEGLINSQNDLVWGFDPYEVELDVADVDPEEAIAIQEQEDFEEAKNNGKSTTKRRTRRSRAKTETS